MDQNLFKSLKQGLKEAKAFKEGTLPLNGQKMTISIPDVKAIRHSTGMTQDQFATLFGWSKDTVSSWEQGRRIPDHSARAMLTLIAKDPTYVMATLRE